MLLHEFHSPRSTACSSNSDGGSGSLRLSSSRSRTLDLDLKNAPSYHHAVMRLLPHALHRSTHHQPAKDHSLALHRPPLDAIPETAPKPQYGHRECLCDKERKHYRKDWRNNDDCNSSRVPHKKMENVRLHFETQPDHSNLNQSESTDTNYSGRDHQKGSHFKSSSLYLEVKLAEMLSNSKHSGIDPSVPDANRFSVCWQLLGELSRMKTPFARVLSWIYQELDKSIYSDYVTAKSSLPTFQRVPYFELVSRVKARKLDIEEERIRETTAILAYQSEIGRVDQEIKELKEEVTVAEGLGRKMEKTLTTTLDALQATIAQVSTLQEEMLQLRKKMKEAKVEQAHAHEIECEQMIRKERHDKLEENYKFMSQELQEAQAALETVRCEAADSIPKQELAAARAKVEDLRSTFAELQAKAALQLSSAGQLTPRPQWDGLLGKIRGSNSTAELLGSICRQNVSLTENISRLQQDCAVAGAAMYERTNEQVNLPGLRNIPQAASAPFDAKVFESDPKASNSLQASRTKDTKKDTKETIEVKPIKKGAKRSAKK